MARKFPAPVLSAFAAGVLIGSAVASEWSYIQLFGQTAYTASSTFLANIPTAVINLITIISLVIGLISVVISIIPLLNKATPSPSNNTDPSTPSPYPSGSGPETLSAKSSAVNGVIVSSVILRIPPGVNDLLQINKVLYAAMGLNTFIITAKRLYIDIIDILNKVAGFIKPPRIHSLHYVQNY